MDVLRARCLRAAAERWNWDRESETLLAVYSEILPGPASVARVWSWCRSATRWEAT